MVEADDDDDDGDDEESEEEGDAREEEGNRFLRMATDVPKGEGADAVKGDWKSDEFLEGTVGNQWCGRRQMLRLWG